MSNVREELLEWVKSNYYLCDCLNCDCHYVYNDCACQRMYHNEFLGHIHWIEKC